MPEQTTSKSGVSKRLTPPELLDQLKRQHQGTSNTHSALLVVHLNRSDRLYALGQHPYAKPVLTEVAIRINTILRPGDHFAIITPDEFWILLSDLASETLAELASRTLRESLMQPINVTRENDRTSVIQIRPVIGGGWTPSGTITDPMTVLSSAAEAAVRARNADEHVVITQVDTDATIVHRDTLEREMRAALYGNEFNVYFQPQIDINTGRCISAEALIRWTREDGKQVNPALIASICEERGMMAQLTQYVLNTALRNLMFWTGQGIDISVGVNLSAVTLTDGNFPAQVEQALSTWGVSGDKLTLELTESAIVQHEASAIDFMRELKTLGCQLGIDDFGTGYSSFSYLRKFPLDELKIDQSFVRHMATDKGDRKIVSALVDLAHTFEMHAVAEGIENQETLGVLRDLGCNLGQGYHFAKPMPADDFVQWFETNRAALADSEDA